MILLKHYNKFYLILAIVISINLFLRFLPNKIFSILGILFIISATILYKNSQEKISSETRWPINFIFILSIIGVIGSLFFYLYQLSNFFILTAIITILFKTIKNKLKLPKIKFDIYIILKLIYLIGAQYLIYLLLTSASSNNITSPWLNVPNNFIFLFFILTTILFFAKARSWLLGIHFIIFFSLTAFIYILGFGFDQFVHGAAQKYILEHGTITPKTLQYIALYSINIFINKITLIPIDYLDRFFLPVLSFTIPASALIFIKDKSQTISAVSLLLLPMSYLIVTTPQGVANLILLIIILLSISNNKSWFLSLTTFLIHPLTGFFAIGYTGLIKTKFKKISLIFIMLSPATSFAILNFGGLTNIKTNLILTFHNFTLLLFSGGYIQHFNFWLDIFYFINFIKIPALIILSLIIIKKYKNAPRAPIIAFTFSILSFFIVNIVSNFSYLISYEQKNYPERIFYISLLFLTPYLLIGTMKIIKLIKKQSLIFKISSSLIFAILVSASFYTTYPRYDNYQNYKGKNVTNYMINAVNIIKKDANNKDYVVLTDQTVSAAALKIDGFKKYYPTEQGEIFYYPIPTGGDLYQKFLDIVYNDAGVKALEKAKYITGADVAYFALPSYWENYQKIKENLKPFVKKIFEDENITIFRY